jgi:hypothetical protein
MKLLFETTETKNAAFNDYSVIVENTNPREPQKIKIKGPYIACDCVNVNGRTYSLKYFAEKVVPEYMNTWVNQKRAYAELNHPQSHVVDPKNACDLIENLEQQGNVFLGESIVLNGDTRLGIPGTPNGDILAAILLRGGRIGKSTRGAVDNPNNKTIDENNQYNLITVDTVLDPSGPGCYINDVILEEKDYMVNEHGLIVECAYSQLEKNLNNYKSTFDQSKKSEYLFNAFNEFLTNLRK